MIGGYPLVLNLQGRRCVVVGGGAVAERKVGALLQAGANVLVVAPSVSPALRGRAADGALEVRERSFEAADLDGVLLVFAATDRPDVNRAVAEAARARGVLVNLTDDPETCDFTVPATVRRGELTLAISTGARSPAFARHLRQELEAWLSPERCLLLELVAELRRDLRTAGRTPSADAWQRAMSDVAVAEAIEVGDRDGARARLRACLSTSG